MLNLYDKTNIDILKRDIINQSNFFDYFIPMIENGSQKYISNINCELKILEIDNNFLPIVFAEENYNDSLYVSILSHYIKYTIQEFKKFINNKFLKFILISILNIFEKYFIKNKINKAIFVNSALISTNLYPELNKEQIETIINFFKEKYPDYLIAFKNINKFYNENLYNNLNLLGSKFIISRQIFVVDKVIKSKLKSRYLYKINKDIKRLNNSEYKIISASENEDWNKVKELYSALYIEKYSEYNPKYTEDYFKLIQKSNYFDLKLLKSDEKMLGMSVVYSNSSIITVPALGYDMSEHGIYSIINAYHTELFNDNYQIFNMSAGIADYKMQRGAKPVLEYMAIYYKHLKLSKRIMYKILEIAVNITIPILCKKKLCGFVPNNS